MPLPLKPKDELLHMNELEVGCQPQQHPSSHTQEYTMKHSVASKVQIMGTCGSSE